MGRGRFSGAVATAVLVAATLAWRAQAINGQSGPRLPIDIPSLTEAGEGLSIRQRTERSGVARFASAAGRGVRLAMGDDAPAEGRARAFARQYGRPFGLSGDQQLEMARGARTDALGVEHVRFRQVHQGLPVVPGEFAVHMRGARVLAANGHIVEALPERVTASLPAAAALQTARNVVASDPARGARPGDQFSEPRLEVFDKASLEPTSLPPRVAWFIEATNTDLREWIWVDADLGAVLHHFSQLADARDREVYDTFHSTDLPGVLSRVENSRSSGDPEVDSAFLYAGVSYDFYNTRFGRDSFDNLGTTIRSTVHYGVNVENAYWNGSQMVYGEGYAVGDDVVAHELTHAVTQHTANLLYYRQSGALNESYSDIMGEAVDLTDAYGIDTAETRWQIGEDLVASGAIGGIIRDMEDPTSLGHAATTSDSNLVCTDYDNGGVHLNSGIPNKAFVLMVDGGTFNGRTVTAIGLTRAMQIQYRALTTYLLSGATFPDNYQALTQSCSDLIGSFGITASHCTQVQLALDAVEMARPLMCSGAVQPPALCPTGEPPGLMVYEDGFETLGQGWVSSSNTATLWQLSVGAIASGTLNVWSPNPGYASDHRLRMSSGVLIPVGAKLAFDHLFEFDSHYSDAHDGGVVEYSVDDTNWLSAGALFEAGRSYNGTVPSGDGNPLAGRSAFVKSSHGYTRTRLNLASLAGQTVKFRFRTGTGADTWPGYGWAIDNVRIYQCTEPTSTNLLLNDGFLGTSGWNTYGLPAPADMVFNVTNGVFQWYRAGTQAVVFQNTGAAVPSGMPLVATFSIGNSTTVRKRISVLTHDSNFSDLSVCTFTMEPGAPLTTYSMKTHTTQAWTNASISFYAANGGNEGGGFYRLDDVTFAMRPELLFHTGTEVRTDCVDPTAPAAGGATGVEMIGNGAFTLTMNPWTPFGNLSYQLSTNVFEFFKLAGTPAGVLLQNTGFTVPNDQALGARFQLGNSSNVRQRVTVLIHDGNFSDIAACTFFVPPGQALNDYAMRVYATKAWTNATVSVYPATVGNAIAHAWLRLDNVSMIKTATPPLGTECFEPGAVIPAF